jgi:archaellum component FlaC
VSRKLNEIQKLNDTIKGLNTKISVLLLEVENAKKTYNIFAPPTSHSSHGNIKKIELELPISISLN